MFIKLRNDCGFYSMLLLQAVVVPLMLENCRFPFIELWDTNKEPCEIVNKYE